MVHNYFLIRVICGFTGDVVFELVMPKIRWAAYVRNDRARYIKDNWCLYHRADPTQYYGEVTECTADAFERGRHGLLPLE